MLVNFTREKYFRAIARLVLFCSLLCFLTCADLRADDFTEDDQDNEGSVTSFEIEDNTVNSEDITDGSITMEDLDPTLITNLFADYANGGDDTSADRILGNNDPYALILETNNTDRVHIQANGDVGVGTSSPLAKLHVAGDLIADNLTANAITIADLFVTNDFQLPGLDLTGDSAEVTGDATVGGDADVGGDANVTGNADIDGDVDIEDNLTVGGDTVVNNLTINGTLNGVDLTSVASSSVGADPPAACDNSRAGEMFLDTDSGILYVCDSSRNLWLSLIHI